MLNFGFIQHWLFRFPLAFMVLIAWIPGYGQQKGTKFDSLIQLSNNPVDTIKLNALKKLTWDSRFTDPLKGFEYAFDGLALAENLKRGKDMAILHNYIGVLATKINSLDKARIHIQKAYRIADSLNIPTEKAYALNNLGEIFYHTGKNDSSLIPLKQAAEIFKSLNDLNGLAYAYNQMGMALRNQKKFDEAYKYHQSALELREKLNHKEFVAKALLNMGIDMLEKGDYVKARSCFEQMDTKQLDSRPYFSVAYQILLIGKTYEGEKDLSTAIKFFKNAYKSAQSMNLYPEMRDVAKNLSDVFNLQNNHQTALFYYNLYKIWDDSVKKSDLIAEYKQLEMQKAFEQKYKYLEYKMQQDIDNQKTKLFWSRFLIYSFIAFFIVLAILLIKLYKNSKTIAQNNKLLMLQKADIENKNEELYAQNLQILSQNQAIASQRDELAMANATKDKFFSIIAHDLRGPVGNLTAFFNLIIEGYQDKIDKKLMEFFLEVNASVQQTYFLLENLLTWAQIQSGTIPFNPRPNNIYSIVDNNLNLYRSKATEKKITILNQLDTDLLTEFDTYMIDSVVRNLLTNAIKFTGENGTITISDKKKLNSVEIRITDTGVGMKPETVEQLFRIDVKHKTRIGTHGEKGTGLGLILCKEFVEKHRGKLRVESEPGKGSCFSFTLPLKD